MVEGFDHIPVMVQEVKDCLNLREGAIVVDCTLGLGGHSSAIRKIIGPEGRLIGLDQDSAAIEVASARLKDLPGDTRIVKSNFRKLEHVLSDLGITGVDAVLFDLGVSSLQLDDAARGFSFRQEGPLDMRMDQEGLISAFELVNSLSEEELAHLLWQFGEERFSRRIARVIVQERALRPIETTKELADIVSRAMPFARAKDGIHPATRSFQAIRIFVNKELESLESALDQAFRALKPTGRLAVISFHSLEDRIVKERFRALAHQGAAELVTKKPLRPSAEEESSNPRSRSARLRALERRV